MVQQQFDKLEKALSILFQNEERPIDEEWKEYAGSYGLYWVSNKGRVLSLHNKEPRILKPYYWNGYSHVDFYGKNKRIHRLVAQLFIPNPENKAEVHHKDRNRHNNNADNLQWVSKAEHDEIHRQIRKEQQNDRKEKILSSVRSNGKN